MKYFSLHLFFIVLLLASAFVCANAQGNFPDASTGSHSRNKEDLPDNIKETLAKGRIEREEKNYQELLDRAEQATQISEQIHSSFDKQKKLTADDRKKIERFQKLIKKIRKDLGGENQDADDNNPKSLSSAIEFLWENSTELFDEIKKATRYSISVSAIEKTNQILNVLQFIQSGKN